MAKGSAAMKITKTIAMALFVTLAAQLVSSVVGADENNPASYKTSLPRASIAPFDDVFGLNTFFEDTFGWASAPRVSQATYGKGRNSRPYQAQRQVNRSLKSRGHEAQVGQAVSPASLRQVVVFQESTPEWQEGIPEIAATMPSLDAPCDVETCREAECELTLIDPWRHRRGIFGESLFLRARNAEVAYAIPIDGPIAPGTPAPPRGAAAVVDPDYEPSFRTGFSYALSDCSSMTAAFTHFESQTSDEISVDAPSVVRALVLHPSTASAATDGLDANADYGLDMDLVDVDYRAVSFYGDQYALNYIVGARYARLDQNFASQFAVLGLTDVRTDVDFDGGGLRLGLDGERHACGRGFFVYGRGMANFLAGEFRAEHFQASVGPGTEVETSWKSGRIVPILELELGAGWQSQCGRWRFSAGYQAMAWYNTVKVADYISAVQSSSYLDLGDTLTFDGLVARAEIRF